jgi:hypothetical protein
MMPCHNKLDNCNTSYDMRCTQRPYTMTVLGNLTWYDMNALADQLQQQHSLSEHGHRQTLRKPAYSSQ